jgi:tetratricopeptide (TPR) repeat protein
MRSIVLLLVFLLPVGAGLGRRALERLEAGDAAAAEALFREGITEAEAQDPEGAADAAVRAALWNDLGLALLARGDSLAPRAADAFDAADGWSAESDRQALAAYNAGVALARGERWAPARDRFVRALILQPDYAEARHNLEVVLRHLRPEGNQNQGRPPEPSEFARRIKQQADSLVAARRYGDALALLQDGLQRDSTVGAFQREIQRLEAVTGIARDSSAAPGAAPDTSR